MHVSSAHPLTDNRIHFRECVSLQKAGYEVTFIGVSTNSTSPSTGVALLSIPQRNRLRRMLFSSAQAIFLAINTKAQIIHLHDPELIPYILPLRILGKKVIYDSHEDLSTQILNKPYLRGFTAQIIGQFVKLLLQLTRFANFSVAATETIAQRLPSKNVVLVRNFPPIRPEDTYLAGQNSKKPRDLLVYPGVISSINGAEVMIDSLSCEEMPTSWRLNLAGRAAPEILSALKTRAGWEKVIFHGQVDPDQARNIILESKIGVVVETDNPHSREGLPTKMFEYFAAGIPVIASDFPILRPIVLENNCGLLIEPNSPIKLAEAVNYYDENPEILEEHSKNAWRVSRTKFNWESEGASLVKAYSSLI